MYRVYNHALLSDRKEIVMELKGKSFLKLLDFTPEAAEAGKEAGDPSQTFGREEHRADF